MEENKSLLLHYAMSYGLMMGIYWVAKYLFFIIGNARPPMLFAYEILSVAVPFIACYQTNSYRKIVGGKISFFHAWQFGIMLYFFAALIVSIEHYVFFRYIAPANYLEDVVGQTTTLLKSMNADEKIIDSVRRISLTPIKMAIQGIFNNIFYGIIFSLPVAAWVSRKRTGQ